jgi:deoxycitidine kinase
MNKKIISVEGNIGVGKSTFISILKNKWPNCDIVSEPIELWKDLTNEDNKNILQMFYEDINRWSYTFQNLACITRMMKIEDKINESNCEYIFLDRSLATDKHVFEKMLFENNNMNLIEHKMYNLWCDFYDKYVRNSKNYTYIYLKCDPNICLNRIKKRGRSEEESINLKYLEDLNKYHDEWLLNNKNAIVIDCNESFEEDENKQEEFINLIRNKLLVQNDNLEELNKLKINKVTENENYKKIIKEKSL